MATSKFRSQQFISGDFIESCGTVLFDMSPGYEQVCLFHLQPQNEWLLPKGRRREGEARHVAALRETREETGYRCDLYPVEMPARAPLSSKTGETDEGLVVRMSIEPFYLTIRDTTGDDSTQVKLIFWYIAQVDATTPVGQPEARAEYETHFFSLKEALEELTFEDDRNVLRQAVKLLNLDSA